MPPHASLHVVLLAGGSGTRFWPMSRRLRPKQLLPLAPGGRTLLEATWARARTVAGPSRIWVVAPRALVRQVRGRLPHLRRQNVLVEPTARDTGPAVALASAAIERSHPGAVLAVLPTDHHVEDRPAFARALRAAAAEAGRGALVCLGARPTRPATGFGWLRCRRPPRAGTAVAVERFVEKPTAARAAGYLRSGRYLWNCGIFVWRASRFLEELDRTAPRVGRAARAHLAGDATAWGRAPRISVDRAVMERATDVRAVLLDAGWDDLGSWDAAARLASSRRAGPAGVVRLDSDGSVMFGSDGRLGVLVGVPGVVIVDTPDALLVVAREHAERVREAVRRVRAAGREEVL